MSLKKERRMRCEISGEDGREVVVDWDMVDGDFPMIRIRDYTGGTLKRLDIHMEHAESLIEAMTEVHADYQKSL